MGRRVEKGRRQPVWPLSQWRGGGWGGTSPAGRSQRTRDRILDPSRPHSPWVRHRGSGNPHHLGLHPARSRSGRDPPRPGEHGQCRHPPQARVPLGTNGGPGCPLPWRGRCRVAVGDAQNHVEPAITPWELASRVAAGCLPLAPEHIPDWFAQRQVRQSGVPHCRDGTRQPEDFCDQPRLAASILAADSPGTDTSSSATYHGSSPLVWIGVDTQDPQPLRPKTQEDTTKRPGRLDEQRPLHLPDTRL